jgi:hypothetical protein
MSVPYVSRRAVLLGTAGLAVAPLFSRAADGGDPRYAVMSIIGDKVTLIGYRPQTGSNLDQNDRRVIPVSAPVLDNTTLLAVDDAVKRLQPRAVTTLLASRDPRLFALQDQPLDKPGDAAAAVAAIKELLQQSKATRLILVAPYRSEARFQLRDNLIGSGKLAGLGFYVDRMTRIQLVESGEAGTGYLAPYAYLSVSLIDAGTMTTIRRSIVTESQLLPTSAAKDATVPWDTLTNEQKVEMLQALIGQGIDRAVSELLAGA